MFRIYNDIALILWRNWRSSSYYWAMGSLALWFSVCVNNEFARYGQDYHKVVLVTGKVPLESCSIGAFLSTFLHESAEHL